MSASDSVSPSRKVRPSSRRSSLPKCFAHRAIEACEVYGAVLVIAKIDRLTDDYDPWDNAFTGKIKIVRVKHKEAPSAHDEHKGGGLAHTASPLRSG